LLAHNKHQAQLAAQTKAAEEHATRLAEEKALRIKNHNEAMKR